MANAHRRNDYIDRIQIGDEVIEGWEETKSEILSFYQQSYTENEPWRGEILSFYQQSYTENEPWRPTTCFGNLAERNWLEREFEEEEIYANIKMCVVDKVARLYGFTMRSFSRLWKIIKKEVTSSIAMFP